MSKCFSCKINSDVSDILRHHKKQYLQKGIVVFYYRLSPSEPVMICDGKSFNVIFETKIKPNLNNTENAPDFAHIAEFE